MKLDSKICFSLLCALTISSPLSFAKKESVKDYSARLNESARSMAKLARKAKRDKTKLGAAEEFKALTAEFGLTTRESNRLAQAISDGKTNILTALYASLGAKEMGGAKKGKRASLDAEILDFATVVSVSQKGKPLNRGLGLNSTEFRDAGGALKKKTNYAIEMLSWTKKEVDTHASVMRRTAEIYAEKKITPEEALVLAIMEVRSVDKEGAMKIIRKLKSCV